MDQHLSRTAPDAAMPLPIGIRIAASLCWLAGVWTILMAVGVSTTSANKPGTTTLPIMVVSFIGGVSLCVAGYMTRSRGRFAAALAVLAWVFPTALTFLNAAIPRTGNLVMLAAALFLLGNWKHLR